MDKVSYFTESVPNSVRVYLNARSVLSLAEPVPAAGFEKIARYVARKAVVARAKAFEALGNGSLPAIDVLNGVRRFGVDVKLALSEAGFDAVLSPVDKSIHPIADDLEYDPMGKAKLSEHAEKCGMIPVYRYEPMYSATRDTSATGALSSSPTEQPPSTQRRVSLSQNSTESVSPSVVTPLTSKPSTNLGSSTTSSDITSSIPQTAPLKIGERHPATGRPIYHETDDLDDLFKKAKDSLPAATELLQRVAGMVPGAIFKPPAEGQPGMIRVKTNMGRVRDKLNAGRAPSNLSDVIGGRVWVDNLDQIADVVKHLSDLTGQQIIPHFDDDFSSGLGRTGYRARHVQIPVPGTGISMEVQIMPKEIGEVQEEAHQHYDKFREPKALLSEVIKAKEMSSKVFNDAFRRHVERVTGKRVGEPDSLFHPTEMGEPQTDAHDEFGNPLPVVPDGDAYVPAAGQGASSAMQMQSKTPSKFLDIVNPADREGPVPNTLADDLGKTMGLSGHKTLGEAYAAALDALKAQGDPNPRGTLHRLIRANGIDGIRYVNSQGQKAWIPMSSEQIYDPSIASNQAVRVRMSEFAAKKGMIEVDDKGVQLSEPTIQLSWRNNPETAYYNPDELAGEGPYLEPLAAVDHDPKTRASQQGASNPYDPLRSWARRYMERMGNPLSGYEPDYEPMDQNVSKGLADFWEDTPHSPNDPNVQRAYASLEEDLKNQFQSLMSGQDGMKVQYVRAPETGSGYKTAQDVIHDVTKNGRMMFDTLHYPADHPMAKVPDWARDANGNPMNLGEVFRSVHDTVGHVKEGYDFWPSGEENAWLQHAVMMRPDSLPAMTNETRAMVNWFASGRHLRRPDGSLPGPHDPDFKPFNQRPLADWKAIAAPENLIDLKRFPSVQRALAGAQSKMKNEDEIAKAFGGTVERTPHEMDVHKKTLLSEAAARAMLTQPVVNLHGGAK